MTVEAIEIASQPAAEGCDRHGIDYAFSDGQHLFWMWSGHGNHAMSAQVSASEALAQWQPHLAAAGAQWLLPWLARIAAGETVEPTAIVAAAGQRAR